MITAIANTDDGKRIIFLGVSRENVKRLTAGQPIRVSAESHPGFPTDVVFLIGFGETERELTDKIKALITDQTKIITVPRKPGAVS